MILNLFESVDYLAIALNEHFEKSPFVYKGIDEVKEYTAAKPTVYRFCVPPEDRNDDGYPLRAPAIALVLTEATPDGGMMTARFEAHICVINPSTSDAASVTGNNQDGFAFQETREYRQDNTYRDLYEYALRLAEETLETLERTLIVSDLTLTPPDPALDGFPYATAIVSGVIKYRKTFHAVSNEIAQFL